MKIKSILLLLIFIIVSVNSFSQVKYEKLTFDDTICKTPPPDCKFKAFGSDFYFNLDSSVWIKSRKSLNVFCGICYPGFNGQFIFELPNFTGDTVHVIKMTGYILTDGSLNAGFWCKVNNGREMVGYGNSLKRVCGFPEALDCDYLGNNEPPIPYNWDKYEINVKVKGGYATRIQFGGFVLTGKAWFDDFEIYIDGKKVNNILIPRDDVIMN